MEPLNVSVKNKPVEVIAKILMYQAGPNDLIDFESPTISEYAILLGPVQYDDASTTSGIAGGNIKEVYIVQNGRKLHGIAERQTLVDYIERYRLAMPLVKITWSNKGCYVSSPDITGPQELTYDYHRVINTHLYRRAFGCRAAARRVAHAIKEGDRIGMGRATLLVRHLARKPSNSLSHIHSLMSSEAQMTNGPSAAENDEHVDDKCAVNNTDGCLCGDSTVSTVNDRDSDVGVQVTPSTAGCLQRSGSEPKICRICLEDEQSGPLVVPCKCNGSMKYVHLACVRTWVQGRLKIKDEEGKPHITYFLQNLKCELCSVPYPSYVDVESVWTDFLGIEEPAPPYAVLEPENSSHTGLHIASIAKQPVTIGRSSESGIVLQDISVSRCHAILQYCDGQFVIEDKCSKFGTVLYMGDNFTIPVERDHPIAIKIGTDVLCIEARSSRASLSALCCFAYNPNSVRVIV
ncbi:uncharacterized protein BXIN_2516 [Babesia sp. Xinjiang]|uniref:uncharacterized protein n=1 Tax=Babesia sp. Xinjiang TaxID=462227 RepID=UPI000A246F28|nr:uncharacterized protein BXIN_2516 [Babesia sp. Xinjiang]ORM41435.1 hypothetical protein BXIN_2516 [Babesia sp. Xinjiang]